MAEKNLMILCDTNVIIEVLKGNEKTIIMETTMSQYQGENLLESSVTYTLEFDLSE